MCLEKYFLSSYVCHAMFSYHCIILGFLQHIFNYILCGGETLQYLSFSSLSIFPL